jgi:hypothetical protein
MEQSSEKTALGLRPRLFAAGAFMIAAIIPALWFGPFLPRFLDGNSRNLDTIGIWLFVIVPVSAAAFGGFPGSGHDGTRLREFR